jgi:hypothetical protein
VVGGVTSVDWESKQTRKIDNIDTGYWTKRRRPFCVVYKHGGHYFVEM